MGKVFIKSSGRGIGFLKQFMNQSPELRTKLIKGETVELDENLLKLLIRGTYEIVNKAPVEDSPSAPADEEPTDSPEENFKEVSESDAESSTEEDTQEAASSSKPKHKRKKKHY